MTFFLSNNTLAFASFSAMKAVEVEDTNSTESVKQIEIFPAT